MLGWEISFSIFQSMCQYEIAENGKCRNPWFCAGPEGAAYRPEFLEPWKPWLSQKRWKQSTADHRCYYSFLCCFTLIHNLNWDTFFSKSKIQNKFEQMSGYKPKRPAPPPPNMPSHDKLRTYFDRWTKIISLVEDMSIILGLMQTSLEQSHLRSYKRPWWMGMERNSTWPQSTWW